MPDSFSFHGLLRAQLYPCPLLVSPVLLTEQLMTLITRVLLEFPESVCQAASKLQEVQTEPRDFGRVLLERRLVIDNFLGFNSIN